MSQSQRAHLDEDQLRSDAFELAHHLMQGRGLEALEVVYGGSYDHPAGLAALLRYTTEVVQFRSNTRPRRPA